MKQEHALWRELREPRSVSSQLPREVADFYRINEATEALDGGELELELLPLDELMTSSESIDPNLEGLDGVHRSWRDIKYVIFAETSWGDEIFCIAHGPHAGQVFMAGINVSNPEGRHPSGFVCLAGSFDEWLLVLQGPREDYGLFANDAMSHQRRERLVDLNGAWW